MHITLIISLNWNYMFRNRTEPEFLFGYNRTNRSFRKYQTKTDRNCTVRFGFKYGSVLLSPGNIGGLKT